MRLSKIYSLLVLLLLTPSLLFASELVGTIIAVDTEKGRLTIQTPDHEEPVLLQLGPELIFERPNGAGMPGCICPNKQIRAQGEWNTATGIFEASSLCGSGKGQRHDPTGVRGRIGRGCRLHDRLPPEATR